MVLHLSFENISIEVLRNDLHYNKGVNLKVHSTIPVYNAVL